MGREEEDLTLVSGPDSPGHRAVYLLTLNLKCVYYSDSFTSKSGRLPFPILDKETFAIDPQARMYLPVDCCQ